MKIIFPNIVSFILIMSYPPKLLKVINFFQTSFKFSGVDIFSDRQNFIGAVWTTGIMTICLLNGIIQVIKNRNDTESVAVCLIFATYGLLSTIKLSTIFMMKNRYLNMMKWIKDRYMPYSMDEITLVSKDIMEKCLDETYFVIKYLN